MKFSTLRTLIPVAVCALFPLASFAAVQNMDGGSAVYLDYPEGKDEIIVDNFTAGEKISWDIYTSATPEEKDSWELRRTYQAKDQTLNDSYYYSIEAGRAVELNGDFYFVVDVQSLEDFGLFPVQQQIWQVSKRGGKPHLVLQIDGSGFHYGRHMPLIVLNNTLITIDGNGDVYESTDGTTWTLTANIVDQFDVVFSFGDLVSNGTKAFISSDGDVYSSTDARTWTLLGNPCTGITGCSLTNLVPRAKKGVIAATTVFGDVYTQDTLWVYAKHKWTKGSENIRTLSGMELINGTIYALQERGKSGYKNAIKTVSPHAIASTLRSPRDGGLYSILTDHLAMIVYKDASYITLVHY